MELGAVFSNNSPANHVWINADFSQKVSWVREKLTDRNVTNFAKDWKDALLIRELVNATQPGLILQNFMLTNLMAKKTQS